MNEPETSIEADMKAFGSSELDRLKGLLNVGSDHSRMVGRVLRAHLLVEISMRRHVEAKNPKLGSLESLGLSFDRLRKMMLNVDGGSMPWAAAPLAALNTIRNKFAHRLDATVSQEDLKPLTAFLRQMDGRPETMAALEKSPAATVEVFALLFGLLVSASAETTRRIAENEERIRTIHADSARILAEFLGPSPDESDGV